MTKQLRLRAAAGLFTGCAAGITTWLLLTSRSAGAQGMDFTYPWLAARALAAGQDPYAYVRNSVSPFLPVLFYPATAGIVALPFACLTAKTAAVAFIAVSCGFLAFAITKNGFWRLAIFLSAPAYQAYLSVQWSPLLAAAALCTPALGLLVAKPNIALPLLAMQTERRAFIYAFLGGAALLATSLLMQPHWPANWLRTLRGAPVTAQYLVPLVTPWGAWLALAAIRWRRPEARLLLAFAAMPQNFFFYDQLPLLLVASSRRSLLMASILSWIAFLAPPASNVALRNVVARSLAYLPQVILGMYLPALVMVLRRPNEGAIPSWLERKIARTPRWLRGEPRAA